ncbi:hypothetical protein SAMN05880582_10675 [Rhizobium sp. RU20A]|uniref:hypothetical protein n=1 Tax=Rhizobium sp. RU20A TaxID=1907412 RepID=UPI000956ECDB|nr:hypothetical protein [Rhizobium sp. RU20A]SIR07408.1 hypothetical protein SAMN05880582_10675 [Rhizobium sp. RU20A]
MMAKVRVYGSLVAMLAGTAALSGCMSSPTYGTDKTAAEHLVDDLGSTLAFTPDTNKTNTKYQPRAGLVLPPGKEAATLVQPQATLASRENNPAWVESPEETRQRLREEADANKGSTTYVSPLAKASANGRQLSAKEQQEAYREARRIQMGAYSDKRRFLSDPPLEYRKLPEQAVADLGEPERVKERRRKQEAEMKNTGSKWYWPF